MEQQTETDDFEGMAHGASPRTLFVVLMVLACSTPTLADGGAVQFERTASSFVITVFTAPHPVRAGPVDISLMIQDRENQQPVLDCHALVQLHKGAMSIRCEATHEAAQNKLLYAVQVNIPEPGEWELKAVIKRRDDSVSINAPIAVSGSSTRLFTYWRGLAFPPILISLFVLNQWVKRREKVGRAPFVV